MAEEKDTIKETGNSKKPKTGVEKLSEEKEDNKSTMTSEEEGVNAGTGTEETIKSNSSIKWITYFVLLIAIIIFTFNVLSDRQTPYTDQARINGLVIPITSRVSGYLTDIRVDLHSRVEVGDTLFQLDRRPFLLAIQKAEANLDNTAQNVSARTASVKSSAGRLGVARAQLDRAQRNYDRVQLVLKDNPGALSLADRDQAETSLSQAVEQVASSEADLERAQQSLGVSGPENPQFRASITALEQAQLDLAFSTVIATTPGVIESLYIDRGYYSQAGQPIATFVSYTDVWIQANMKENNISNLKVGDKVEFSLDVEPGKVFEGSVRSVGYGVSMGSGNRGDLPSITGTTGWLRDPQRFPVIITFDNSDIVEKIRIGGQVDVVAYTGDNGILNTLGRWRIRVNSWFSYVR
jgi:multidrug resistance efflux pump